VTTLDDDNLTTLGWFDILLRLSLAIAAGGMIGLERQLDRKPAGLRTHMLVSLGAALYILSGTQATSGEGDVTRVIQGIATGIGFLGAGEIFSRTSSEHKDEIKVVGLTSAAAIWVSAGLGLAAGLGQYSLCIIGALLTLFTLRVVKRLE
jgi:putative Mg2+ transporter-C (MgtC) family protein